MKPRLDWTQWRGGLTAALGGFDQLASPAQQAATLAARARLLAREIVTGAVRENNEFLLFVLNGEQYAVQPASVLGVSRLNQLVRVPSAQPHVLGLTEWRGELLPVFSLRQLLDQPERGLSDQQHLLVLGDERVAFGILVDQVDSMQHIRDEQIRGTELSHRYTRGLTNNAVTVLDAPKMIAIMAEETA